MNARVLGAVAATAVAIALTACGGDGDDGFDPSRPPVVDLAAEPPEKLSDYNLFAWDPATGFTFNDQVVSYDLNSALFSDYALKQRAIYVPAGASATYHPEEAFDFPVGSVIVKNFYFPADFRAPSEKRTLIETRLLVRHEDGWDPLPYIWDAEQQDAVLSPSGEVRPISFVDVGGVPRTASYLVPQRNQCESCHARKENALAKLEIVLIGIKARHLNRDDGTGTNQLARLVARGMLTGVPAPADVPAAFDFRAVEASGVAVIPPAELDHAARSYLDINCAHCHNPHGVQGITSQLFLDRANTDRFHMGVCKRPGSAGAGTGGFTFDIVPGKPETSILYFRTATDQVGAMMPLLGRSLTHARGIELLRAWIAAMPPDDCAAMP